MVYILGKTDARKKLKKVITKRAEHGYDQNWVLRRKTAATKKIVDKGGLAEGFNPDLSSEEESSDSEGAVGELPIKRKKRGKKKATTKKGDGSKPTKETRSRDLDDDEENVGKKKPKSTSNTKMAKNQKGESDKAVGT